MSRWTLFSTSLSSGRLVSGFEAAEITALGFDRLGDVHVCVEDESGYGHSIAEGLQSLSVREVGVVVALAKANGRI